MTGSAGSQEGVHRGSADRAAVAVGELAGVLLDAVGVPFIAEAPDEGLLRTTYEELSED